MQTIKSKYFAALLVIMALTANSHASLTFVSTRPGLAANDSVDWGQLGVSGSGVSSGSTVLSTNGLTMTVTSSGGSMERRDQGNGWGAILPMSTACSGTVATVVMLVLLSLRVIMAWAAGRRSNLILLALSPARSVRMMGPISCLVVTVFQETATLMETIPLCLPGS